MKGLLTLVLAVGLVLGVSSAYALDMDAMEHLWVYGTETPNLALIPTGLGLGNVAPPPLVITNTFATGLPVKMVPTERTVAERGKAAPTISEVGKAEPRAAGITSVYKETGYISDQTERFVW